MDGSSEYQVALLIAIGSVGMLALAIGIVLFMVFYQKKMMQEQMKRQQLELDYQHKMMEVTLESQESERKKLAADLHDSIGGMLSAIRMGISTMGKSTPAQVNIDQTKKMLDDTISSVRKISRELMPSTLDKFGLAQALKELCEQLQDTTMITTTFHESGELYDLSKPESLMVFRIIQELLNNAIKHSEANKIEVTIGNQDGLLICVEDNGIGFDINTQRNDKSFGKGLGLYSIENRASLLGAKVDFSKKSKGSKVTLTIPVRHEAKA